MKEERFFYPGAENKEPSKSSDDNSNHESSLHGSMHNGVPSIERERGTRTVEHHDFLGKDNTKSRVESTDYSWDRRPNAEVLTSEITQQIKQIIDANHDKYIDIWGRVDNFEIVINEIQADIFRTLYSHIKNPRETDLMRTFTPDRIRKVFNENYK